jgi:transposase
VSEASRLRVLGESGLVHPNPAWVQAPLFTAGPDFFLAADKVQVKYEMLRAHEVEGLSVSAAARLHGYSRAAYYLVAAAFAEAGMTGLLDERRGRRGPLKLTPEIAAFLTAAPAELSGAELAEQVQRRFGISLHRRTVERARRR